MFSIQKVALPENALLRTYAGDVNYTDCFTTTIARNVSHAEFITAFYTTLLFRTERVILKWAANKPSTDAEAKRLSEGELDCYAAWYVESRAKNQLLMCDFRDRTRSWLMVEPPSDGGGTSTRLYFGSAVVPGRDPTSNNTFAGFSFRILLGFHKIYSVALLYSARSRLASRKL